MNQEVENIQDLLNHPNFEDLDGLLEIAKEQDMITNHNNVSLSEAVAGFKRVSEILHTAIDETLLEELSQDYLQNIKERLVDVRQHAGNIKNENTSRKNPGRGFITSVGKLESYVIWNLSLDLRVGEHLEFNRALSNIKEITNKQQSLDQALQEARDGRVEIESIHTELTDQVEEFEALLDSANDSEDEIQQIENEISDTLDDVKSQAQTIENEHNNVLKKSQEIEDHETRLEENLSEVESRSEKLDQQQESVNNLDEQISELLNGAIAASLDRNFSKRKEELERSAKFWAVSTFVAIFGLVGFSFHIFEDISQVSELGVGTISRATILIPLLVGVWFTSKNYSRKRRLMEEYAFKSTIAQTLEPSRDVLESQLSVDGSDEQLAEFMMVSMGQMFNNPSDNIEASTSDDGDATNIQTVMDMAEKIVKRN